MGPTSPNFRRGPVQPRKRLSGRHRTKKTIEKKPRGRFHDHDYGDADTTTTTTVLMWMKKPATMTKPT